MARANGEIVAHGGEVLVIGPGSQREAQAYRERYRLPFQVVADVNGSTYERFGVGSWFGERFRQTALFVIAPDGQISYARIVNMPLRFVDRQQIVAAVANAAQPAGARLQRLSPQRAMLDDES